MRRNRWPIKGPALTAADSEANRERMRINREADARDRAELDEYQAALRDGNDARATEIAVARYERSRRRAYPQGVIEAERAREQAGHPLHTSVPQTSMSASPATPRPSRIDR